MSEKGTIENGYALLPPDSFYQTNLLNGDSLWEWKNFDGEIIKPGLHPEYKGIRTDTRDYAPPQVFIYPKPNRVATNLDATMLGRAVERFRADPVIEKQEVGKIRTLEYTEEPVYITRTWAGTSTLPKKPEPFFIERLTTHTGLFSDFPSTVTSDSSGKLWIGSSNLISFDGRDYREYSTKSGEIGTLKTLEVDSQNHLWLGDVAWGYAGVREFDGKVLRSYTELARQKESHRNAENLFADAKGRMWIKLDSHIHRLRSGSLQKIVTAVWFNHGRMVLIDCDRNNNLWLVGPSDGKYGKVKNKELITYTLPENPNSSCLDTAGNLWIGTTTSLYKHLTNDSIIRFDQTCGLLNSVLDELHTDTENRLWIRYRNGSIQVIIGNQISTIENAVEGNSSNSASDKRYKANQRFHTDKFGQVWNATFSSGMQLYKANIIRNFFPDLSNPKSQIYCSSKDSLNRIWVLSSDGIYIHDLKTGATYKCNLPDDINGSTLKSIVCWNNKVWFIHNFYLCSFDGIELNIYREEQGYKRRGIGGHLVVDKNNKLWIGGFAGLVSFDGRYFTQELPELVYDKTELSVSNLGVDPDNNIIIGLNYLGFVLHDQVNYNVITKNMGLFYSPNCYFPLGNGRHLYGTTGQGIFYFDKERIVNISVKQGLCNNYVCDIGRDGDGHFWILTDNGINKIDQMELFDFVENKSPSLSMLTLNSRDGYFSNSSYDRAGIIQVGDDLWQNNQQCISIVNTKKLNEIAYSPQVEITQVTINNEAYLFDVDSLFSGIDFNDVIPFTRIPKSLKVVYANNHLTFRFSAPDLDNPHQVQIAYRIKELDENWSKAGSDRTADFRNLPPGRFTLEVKAKSLANKWSKPTIYQFSVLPPWYRTIWAYIAYVLASILSVWGLVRWQTNRYKRENIKLEKRVAARTAEVVAEKNRSEELLLNILPEEVAEELKAKGSADAQLIDQVTVLFTDFKGFTAMSEQLSPKQLIEELNECFSEFDRIVGNFGIEKIKTIGDAYMAAGGLPTPNKTHARDVLEAALEMRDFVENGKAKKIKDGRPYFEIRVGIHSGPVVAGIVGVKKFQYDIWGDTVNTASRMESAGKVGKVNISQATYELLKDNTGFTFESRGKIEAKGKGKVEMYFASRK